ncbi:hypothetical protein [Paraburkholderia bannensis]|nr:hypothetical protein [Paraburkholderia bannensis]
MSGMRFRFSSPMKQTTALALVASAMVHEGAARVTPNTVDYVGVEAKLVW